MTLNIYCVKDNKAPAYTQVFTAVSNGVAIRTMKDFIDRDQYGYGKFTSDYDLYQIGTFDTVTGDVNSKFELVLPFVTIKEMS